MSTSTSGVMMHTANGKQPKLEQKVGGPSKMANSTTLTSTGPATAASIGDKHESWQMELLMERLRSKAKSSHYKSFPEMSKTVRMSLLEKRYALDSVEKSNLQKTLDSMQYCIKVTSRQGLVERLDCLTRQLGLKLSEDTSGLFISSDMFYLEIILDQNGKVQDVKVHHECKMKQQSCSELVSCLQRGDFVDFTTQLEGLASIYQLNAEKKIKLNAFVALQALETDLYNLYSLSAQHFNDIHSLLLKSPLGVVQKRRGGHAMKLSYFVAPYDLLDLESRMMKPLNVELILSEKIGCSVAVILEASTANKLQIQPLLVQQGNSPVYSPIEKHNSTSLPATFVLKLNKPMALNAKMLKQIKIITGDGSNGIIDAENPSSLIRLIVQHASTGAVNNIAKGLFVTLPDQHHCYYMNENKNLEGIVVSSIPFTEPQHVSKILVFLRQQALFNQLLSSCIRNNGSTNTRTTDYDQLLVFEVTALSCQYITISLEHPFDESLAMVEFDLRNAMAIQIRVFCNGFECDERISKHVSIVVQRTMSIPVTLRALIKVWEEDFEAKFKNKLGSNAGGNGCIDEVNFSLPMGPDDGGGSGPGGGGGGSVLGMNGQHATGMNGSGSSHHEFADAKKIKFETHDLSKKRRIGEDFRNSPKSNTIEIMMENEENVVDADDCDESTFETNSDSNNSLGGNQTIVTENLSSSSASTSASSKQTPTSPFPLSNTEEEFHNKYVGKINDTISSPGIIRKNSEAIDCEESETRPTNTLNHQLASNPEDRNLTVSITTIEVGKQNMSSSSVLSNMNLDKRPGIELIPLSNSATSISSSVTITPIPVESCTGPFKSSGNDKKFGGNSSSSSNSNRKNSESKSESDRAKLEKKKKRKHEEHQALLQMGPPHKILSKNISTDGPTSPSGGGRKISSSPVPSKSGSSSSPRHSPVHHSSPKHQGSFGTSSPKHISGSSGGGKPSMSALKSAASGGSPNSKSSSGSSTGKDESSGIFSTGNNNKISSSSSGSSSSRERDRDRERSDKKLVSNPKLKTPAVKLKQLDLATCGASLSAGVQLELINSNSSGEGSTGSSSIDYTDNSLFATSDMSKSSSVAAASTAGMLLLQQAMKNRKSSLSAVIDKLKSAQSGDESSLMLLPELAQQAGFTLKESSGPNKVASSTSASPTTMVSNIHGQTTSSASATVASASSTTVSTLTTQLSSTTSPVHVKSSEYLVKPSSDGIKLTIQNKKGSKSSLSSSSINSKSSSKTGLKPGVSSGPGSKKLQSSQSFSGSFSSVTSSGNKSGSSTKSSFQKSNSSSSLSNSSSSLKSSSKSSSGSSSSSSSGKDKTRHNSKSSSMISSNALTVASQAAANAAVNANALNVMKMLGITSSIQNMEGFVKTLDTKFQIPKLSARSASSGNDLDKIKEFRTASAPTTPLQNMSQSPTGLNDFSLPFNKLPGDVSPLHSAILPNVMQKMFSGHDNAMLLRRSPNLDHHSSNDGFPSHHGKGSTPPTPTISIPPPFPSPLGLQSHAMDFSNSSDSIDNSNLMLPPSRPSSTMSNHSSSDKLIDASGGNNSMDSFSNSPSAHAIAAAAAQFINKLDNTQQLVAALKNHHLNALSNAAAAVACSPSGSGSVTSPTSVSVHIMKSPAPSPLGVPGNSVDDDLMDDALVQIGGK